MFFYLSNQKFQMCVLWYTIELKVPNNNASSVDPNLAKFCFKAGKK